MLERPLSISLSTTRSESSDMAEFASIWLQFSFGFGVTKRERYWRFLVKLREITLGESSQSESSHLWVVEFREKEKNKEDQGEEVRGCYRRNAKRKGGKKKKRRGRKRALWNVPEFGGSGGEKESKEWNKENSKGTCEEEKKKMEKRRKYGTCVEEKKRGEKKKRKKRRRKCYHNIFIILLQ